MGAIHSAIGPIVVPASSANLGCAFDCAAIALNRYLRAWATPRDIVEYDITYSGPGAGAVPRDESNLVVRALRGFAASVGAEERGASIEIQNEIPVGVGLGSSAAAILAGILLGARLYRVVPDAATVLRLGVEIEGHPDNIGAAYLGGLVLSAACGPDCAVLTAKANVPETLEFVAVVPELPMPTEKARAILPDQYSRPDAVHNLQRAALLAAACFSGRFDMVPELFRDRLHQPYRSQLIPGLEGCLTVRHPGLLGAFLSGSGSSVLAIVRHSSREVGELLAAEFGRCGLASQTLHLRAENRGAQDFVDQAKGARC